MPNARAGEARGEETPGEGAVRRGEWQGRGSDGRGEGILPLNEEQAPSAGQRAVVPRGLVPPGREPSPVLRATAAPTHRIDGALRPSALWPRRALSDDNAPPP